MKAKTETASVFVSAGANGSLWDWSVQAAVNGQVSESRQTGWFEARSQNQTVLASLDADRLLLDLPAGPVRTNVSAQTSFSVAEAQVEGEVDERSVRSTRLAGNVHVPLAHRARSEEASAPWTGGDVNLSLGAAFVEEGGGSAGGLDATLAWAPVRKLSLNFQAARSTETPSQDLRLAPVVSGDLVVVYDFKTGRSVEVLTIVGGNPDLRPSRTKRWSMTGSAGPFTDYRFTADLALQAVSSTDGVSGLPSLTPAIEAAFPDRFQRDTAGILTLIDQRPVNLGGSRTKTFSAGLNFVVPLDQGGASGVMVSVNQSLSLEDAVRTLEGLADSDRLAGDGGGRSPQSVNLQVAASRGRYGLNASVDWRRGFRVRRQEGANGPDDLLQNDFGTVGLSLTYRFLPSRAPEGGAEFAAARRGGGAQLQLTVDNLFDARQQARLADGRPAPGFGRDDRDPLGRTVRVTFSRRF